MLDERVIDFASLPQLAARQLGRFNHEETERRTSYRLALGHETIQLGIVEYRILLFLASKPYNAFTRQSIAEAVNSALTPVGENSVDAHVDSLLDQLGVFHDYVQSVPYIGFRFKP